MKTAQPYAQALVLAEQLLELMTPVCERLEIAGSLRRHKAQIGDLELVAIPRYRISCDLFGEEVDRISLLDEALPAWLSQRRGQLLKNGDRYKQFTWGEMAVDLFLVNIDTWAVQFALRTGSADFSHWLVTPQAHGGALPAGYRISEGRLVKGSAVLDTPDELALFAAIGLPWIPPNERSTGRWAHDGPRHPRISAS